MLLGDEESIIQQFGSNVNIITSRDSLLIKVYKFFANEKISSSMKNKLFIETQNIIDWVIVFEEATQDIEEILCFCKENKYNLLLLRKEEEKINMNYDFKIIHVTNLITATNIYETIVFQK